MNVYYSVVFPKDGYMTTSHKDKACLLKIEMSVRAQENVGTIMCVGHVGPPKTYITFVYDVRFVYG